MRDFEKMETDELYALWDGYKRTDWGGYDPMNHCVVHCAIKIRLTPLEMIKMMDELFIRLLKKEGHEINEARR